jgi:hypothetical protein
MPSTGEALDRGRCGTSSSVATVYSPPSYADPMSRTIDVWTWDRGLRPIDLDGPPNAIVPVLETVLTGGLWKEFRKFPCDTVERLLPELDLPPNIRRLVELWIEEAPARS